jgi:hypothetical protein
MKSPVAVPFVDKVLHKRCNLSAGTEMHASERKSDPSSRR